MSPIVFVAVLSAALLHAVWNALVKSGFDKHMSMTGVVIGHVPIALLLLPFVPVPGAAAWPWLLTSVVLHLGYQLFLIAGYRAGDLTQVYPIARGTAPLLVATISVAFLGVSLSSSELLAILLIGAGIISLALVRRSDGSRNPRAVTMALATAMFIASYSLVDGTGARIAGTAPGYWTWAALINAVLFCCWTALTKPGLITALARDRRLAASGFLGGTASYAAYGLVIWAFLHAPIPLVTALRETSIIFALLIGVGVLHEKLDLAKVLATMMTLTGAALLRFAKS